MNEEALMEIIVRNDIEMLGIEEKMEKLSSENSVVWGINHRYHLKSMETKKQLNFLIEEIEMWDDNCKNIDYIKRCLSKIAKDI